MDLHEASGSMLLRLVSCEALGPKKTQEHYFQQRSDTFGTAAVEGGLAALKERRLVPRVANIDVLAFGLLGLWLLSP